MGLFPSSADSKTTRFVRETALKVKKAHSYRSMTVQSYLAHLFTVSLHLPSIFHPT